MWLTLLGGSLLSVLLSQTTSPDPTSTFAQLGIASAICVVCLGGWWIEHKEKLAAQREAREAREECSKLQEERITRERELSSTTIPLLTRTAEFLEAVPRQVLEAQSSGRNSEVGRLLQELREVLDDRHRPSR